MSQEINRSDFADIEGKFGFSIPSPVSDPMGYDRYQSFAQSEIMPLLDKQADYRESIKRQRNSDLAFKSTQLTIENKRAEAKQKRLNFELNPQVRGYVNKLFEDNVSSTDMLLGFTNFVANLPVSYTSDPTTQKFLDDQEDRIKALGAKEVADKKVDAYSASLAQTYLAKFGANADRDTYEAIKRGDQAAQEEFKRAVAALEEVERQKAILGEFGDDRVKTLTSIIELNPTPKDMMAEQDVGNGKEEIPFQAYPPEVMEKAISMRLLLDGERGNNDLFEKLGKENYLNAEAAVKAGADENVVRRGQDAFLRELRNMARTRRDKVRSGELDPTKEFTTKEQEDKNTIDTLQGLPPE